MGQGIMSDIPTRLVVTGELAAMSSLHAGARLKRRRRRNDGHALYLEALEERTLFDGAPIVGNFTVAVNQNSSIAIGTNFFGISPNYTDPDNDPLASVQILTLPNDGALMLTENSVSTLVVLNQIITAADLGNGSGPNGLFYESGSSAGIDSFAWNASDGTLPADAPAAVTIDVGAPLIVAVSKSTNANTPITFSSTDFNNAYSSSNSLQSILIESLPAHGALTFEGNPINVATATSPQTISVSQIGDLVYTPAANYTNTVNSADSFVWAASDGTLFSGTANVTLTVNADLSNFSTSFQAGSSHTFQASDFTGVYSGGTLASITVTTLPRQGTLVLNDVPITANQVIAAADLGNITYNSGDNFAGADSFRFTASDGNINSNPATITLNVNSLYTPFAKNADVNVPFNFTQGDFTNSFASTLQAIEITRLPSFGNLFLTVDGHSTRVTLDQTISVDQLDALSYSATKKFSGTDAFLWEGSDEALDQGPIFVGPPGQVTLTVAAPSLANISNNVGENNALTFVSANFTSALSAAGTLTAMQILSLPKHGTLTLSSTSNSTAITINQTLSASQIDSLMYQPDANFTGSDSFKFTASDGLAFVTGGAQVNLSVAPLLVTGNGISIANGDKSPTAGDFTDFGNDVIASQNGPTLTRKYVLTNLTSGTLNLTAGGNLITGADSGDFSISTPPDTALAPNATTSITINFNPIHNGVRNGTLSLPFTIGTTGASTFTFAIQGTGVTPITTVNSSVLTSTTQTFNDNQTLLVASTGAGKGKITSQDGDIMYLTYTGHLLDGSVFDASSLHGNVPIEIRLDKTGTLPALIHAEATNSSFSNVNTFATGVIQGWNYGLQNMKPGEHRTLIIPSDFGYGNDTTSSALAGKTLIFDVVCQGIDDAPSWGINYNPGNFSGTVAVPPGQKTPSAADGTDFGVLPPGQTYVGATFVGTNNSPVNANGIPLAQIQNTGFKITGPDAKDFIATGTFGNFNLFFKPTAPGVRTATVHFLTNDPQIKDFNFVVKGTSTPEIDLLYSATGTKAFPSTTDTNGNWTTSLPVTIQNFGNVSVPSNTPTTDLTVTAYPSNDTTQAGTIVGQLSDASFVGLHSGKTKTFNIPITLPADLAQGGYNLVLGLNSSQDIFETLTTNNTSTTSENITGSLVSTDIPSHIVDTEDALDGSVVVQVKNSGQYTLPSNEQVSIQLQAMNTNSSAVTPIGLPQIFSVGGMKANGSQTFTLAANSTASFASGPYQIQAVITPVQRILESSITDNTISQTASSAHLSFTSEDPGIDLAASFGSGSAGGASVGGGNVHLKLPVTIENNGNIPVSATASTTDIQIFLHDTANATSDTLVGSIAAQNIKGLAPDKSTTVNVPVTIPLTSMTGDTFTYIVKVNTDPNAPIVDTNSANNTATGTMNVSGNIVSTSLPASISHSAPSTRGVLNVQLLNSGTLAFPTGEKFRVQLLAHNESTGANTVIGTIFESAKTFTSPAANATISFKVTFPHNMTQGKYDLEAQILPSPNFPQSVLSDDLVSLTAANGTTAGHTLTVTVT